MSTIITIENTHLLQPTHTLKHGWITDIAWSPHTAQLALTAADGVWFYAMHPGDSRTVQLGGPTEPLRAVSYARHAVGVAAGGDEGVLWEWVFAANQPATLRQIDLGGEISDIDYLANGNVLVVVDKRLVLVDQDSHISNVIDSKIQQKAVTVAPDGKAVALGDWEGNVTLWPAGLDGEMLALHGHTDRVNALQFNHAGNMLASVGRDGALLLWDVATGDEIGRIIGHTPLQAFDVAPFGVDSLCFSLDDRLVVTGGRDYVARVWDVQTQAKLAELEGHTKPVLVVTLRPDGRQLATASGDNTVRLWDVVTEDR